MNRYTDSFSKRIYYFKCSCGCNEFNRPESMKKLKSFWEGHFLCNSCKTEHNYTSDHFYSKPIQEKLF